MRIVDGYLEIPGQARNERTGVRKDKWIEGFERMRATPDSVLLRMRMLRAGQFAGERDNWTTKDFGPIVVPRKGMTIALDSINRKHYERVIRWETGVTVGEITHSNSKNYTFRQDWYFFVGDNVTNSRDSRFFGFVPADFVIGIVPKGKR